MGGLNASLGLAFGIAQMANLGTTTLSYAWRFSKYVAGQVFNPRNIFGPLRLLARLLFGIKYLSKEEKANERLLRETWNDFNASGFSSSTPRTKSSKG